MLWLQKKEQHKQQEKKHLQHAAKQKNKPDVINKTITAHLV